MDESIPPPATIPKSSRYLRHGHNRDTRRLYPRPRLGRIADVDPVSAPRGRPRKPGPAHRWHGQGLPFPNHAAA